IVGPQLPWTERLTHVAVNVDSHPRGFAPRTPQHAHSLAAPPARSVRVARSLRSLASGWVARQNRHLSANSACRDGALMLASRLGVCPNRGRPFKSLAAVILPFGGAKFAVLNTLNNCAMNSTWCDFATTKFFENRKSMFEKPGQSTLETAVRGGVRPARTAL